MSLRPVLTMNVNRFHKESERLKTFENGWTSTVDPSKLAQAGFYNMFTMDKVQCAFCYGIVGNWEEQDDPLTEHVRHFPLCPFLLRIDTLNVPISNAGSRLGSDVCTRYNQLTSISEGGNDVKTKLEKIGIHVPEPLHRSQASLGTRLCSFITYNARWPSEHIVTSLSLARAGFFYKGITDSVRCFYCNVCLSNWGPDDIPFAEHARWQPRCGYVKMVKGEAYIKECRLKNPPIAATAAAIPVLNTQATLTTSKDETMQKHTDIKSAKLRDSQPQASILSDMNTIKILEEENIKLKEQKQCKICLERDVGVTFLPCGHYLSCNLCAPSLVECPVCRTYIQGVSHLLKYILRGMLTFVDIECLQTDSGRLLVKEIAFLKYDFVQCYLIRAPPDQRFNKKTLNYLAGRHGFRPKDGEHDYKNLKQLIDIYCKGTIAISKKPTEEYNKQESSKHQTATMSNTPNIKEKILNLRRRVMKKEKKDNTKKVVHFSNYWNVCIRD
ncbi:Baculoviral IAP repeat-containing protein 7-B [Nymphon striatum]|nr:Baculoviral IAP repeat-containing protein 7-B [Nymphon striatum]